MKNTCIFLLICGFTLLMSCNSKINNDNDFVKKSVSNTYKEPEFLNDQRLKKIKEIESELQQIFDEHSKSKTPPSGLAYWYSVLSMVTVGPSTFSAPLKAVH